MKTQSILPPSRLIEPIPCNPSLTTIDIPIREKVSGVKDAFLEIPAESQMAALYKLDPASVSIIKRSDAAKANPQFFPPDQPIVAFKIEQGRVMHMQVQMPDTTFSK